MTYIFTDSFIPIVAYDSFIDLDNGYNGLLPVRHQAII